MERIQHSVRFKGRRTGTKRSTSAQAARAQESTPLNNRYSPFSDRVPSQRVARFPKIYETASEMPHSTTHTKGKISQKAAPFHGIWLAVTGDAVVCMERLRTYVDGDRITRLLETKTCTVLESNHLRARFDINTGCHKYPENISVVRAFKC